MKLPRISQMDMEFHCYRKCREWEMGLRKQAGNSAHRKVIHSNIFKSLNSELNYPSSTPQSASCSLYGVSKIFTTYSFSFPIFTVFSE